MRKIISIIVALGLVLAFSAVAMPASAALPACTGNVTISNQCASGTANYTINFTLPVTLTPGNDLLSFTFGNGTSLAGVNATDVTVTPPGLSPSTTGFSVSGTHIEFAVPGAALIPAGTPISVTINDVVNPAGGTYSLVIDYKFPCCLAVDLCTISYKINLAVAKYAFVVDFGKTYPGIAQDFVPPFKACGQVADGNFTTVQIGSLWFDQFELIVKVTDIGCATPCANATLSVNLVTIPAGVTSPTVTLNVSTETLVLNATGAKNFTTGVTLNATGNTTLYSLLHFDTVGKGYQINFKLYCPATGTPLCTSDPPCQAGVPTLVADKTLTFNVYQWKDAAKIVLQEKWNLISLPLVPLVDPPIADVLAAIPAADRANILSIWNYNRCTDKWSVWPAPVEAGQGTLTALVDGDAYWVRVKYPIAPQTPPVCGNITLWVWGTAKPMPPASPAQYPVCEGWNMVGFLGLAPKLPNAYLWNWTTLMVSPVVYTWDPGCWNVQNWRLLNIAADNLVPGHGYWMAFPYSDAIYVP